MIGLGQKVLMEVDASGGQAGGPLAKIALRILE